MCPLSASADLLMVTSHYLNLKELAHVEVGHNRGDDHGSIVEPDLLLKTPAPEWWSRALTSWSRAVVVTKSRTGLL